MMVDFGLFVDLMCIVDGHLYRSGLCYRAIQHAKEDFHITVTYSTRYVAQWAGQTEASDGIGWIGLARAAFACTGYISHSGEQKEGYLPLFVTFRARRLRIVVS